MKIHLNIYFKVLMFLVLGAVFVAGVHVALFVLSPASGTKEYREVLVNEGSSFKVVARELEKEGVISSHRTFAVLGRLMGVDRKIRAGFYSFNTAMKPLDVLEVLRKGKIIEYQVVIPEGYDMDKIADALQAAGVTTKREFLAKATDENYVRSLDLHGKSLEGFLFPATYFFPKGMTLDGIIKQMVSKYHEVMSSDLKARAAELKMTELEVMTLASLIEREADLDSERLLISAVFHNRLKEGIPLQCDPTIIYALQRKGRWNGDLTKKDLRMKDPYNTYIYKGLPPGPISNPGKPSIIAALYPADVDYIYFVSKNDGTHYFSKNLAEHNRAVHKYQVMAKLENVTTVAPWVRAKQGREKKASEEKARQAAPAEVGKPEAPKKAPGQQTVKRPG